MAHCRPWSHSTRFQLRSMPRATRGTSCHCSTAVSFLRATCTGVSKACCSGPPLTCTQLACIRKRLQTAWRGRLVLSGELLRDTLSVPRLSRNPPSETGVLLHARERRFCSVSVVQGRRGAARCASRPACALLRTAQLQLLTPGTAVPPKSTSAQCTTWTLKNGAPMGSAQAWCSPQ